MQTSTWANTFAWRINSEQMMMFRMILDKLGIQDELAYAHFLCLCLCLDHLQDF